MCVTYSINPTLITANHEDMEILITYFWNFNISRIISAIVACVFKVSSDLVTYEICGDYWAMCEAIADKTNGISRLNFKM